MRVIKIFWITALLSTAISFPASAKNICLPKTAVTEMHGDLGMKESDFSFERAVRSIEWLENRVWEVIKSKKTTEELLMSTEQFGIPYPNSVSIVKGALLKQKALLEIEKLEALKLKQATGKAVPMNISSAENNAKKAIDHFCNYLEKATFSD